jgi:hypothetical protein
MLPVQYNINIPVMPVINSENIGANPGRIDSMAHPPVTNNKEISASLYLRD